MVQQLTGEYPAAADCHQQAPELFHNLDNSHGQAEALNRLGEPSLRTSAPGLARDQHTQALAIAHDVGDVLEEAHALKASATATCKTATPHGPRSTCGRR